MIISIVEMENFGARFRKERTGIDEKRDTSSTNRFCFRTIFVSRSFFFFFLFLLRSCSSIIFDSTTRSRHHRLFRIFSLGFRSSRIGLPLNQVNRDGARFSPRIEEEKFADAPLYISATLRFIATRSLSGLHCATAHAA